MELAPLTLVVLLGYGLFVAVCLTAWTAVSFDREPARPAREDAARLNREDNPKGRSAVRERVQKPRVSNDEVRGKRSKPESVRAKPDADEEPRSRVSERPRAEQEEDAFERFIRERPDDVDFS